MLYLGDIRDMVFDIGYIGLSDCTLQMHLCDLQVKLKPK